jgi:hypothetical protein
MSKKITANLQEIQFKIIFDVPEGYSCYTEKSQETFLGIIEQLYNVRESGNGFGCFGIKVEVDTPEEINSTKMHIESMGKTILKLEKIKPPAPPKRKDEYSNVFDLMDKVTLGLKEIYLKQVIYTDDRLFQTLIMKGSCVANRDRMKAIKKHAELKDIVSAVVSFNFGVSALAVTFNKGLTFTENEMIEIAKQIMSCNGR